MAEIFITIGETEIRQAVDDYIGKNYQNVEVETIFLALDGIGLCDKKLSASAKVEFLQPKTKTCPVAVA